MECDYSRCLECAIGFIELFDKALDYNLHFTITSQSTIISYLPLLGNGFQRGTFLITLGSRTVPSSSQWWNLSSRLTHSTDLSRSSYFATDGLPPVSASWRQAPRESRPHIIFFLLLKCCGHSPYVTSLRRRWVCLLWICVAFQFTTVSKVWK
jgi:hypothetical protein